MNIVLCLSRSPPLYERSQCRSTPIRTSALRRVCGGNLGIPRGNNVKETRQSRRSIIDHMADDNYILKITLLGGTKGYKNPELFRCLACPANTKLRQLHIAIVLAFNWDGSHLIEFDFPERTRYHENGSHRDSGLLTLDAEAHGIWTSSMSQHTPLGRDGKVARHGLYLSV